MFIEIVTRRDENVSINISHILFVTSDKKGAVVFDVTGNDYMLKNSYEDVMERIFNALKQ